jgi:eukaryotic-like serine/threonine-protein kinase
MLCPSCNAENIQGARFCAKCGSILESEGPPPEADPLIGTTVGGRYTIERMLGEGGMGRVYEAVRHIAGVKQRVAIKTLHPHLSADAQIVARFHRECGTVAQLRHPNTIKVEDFGQTADGTLYIAMEFVDGRTVADHLEKDGPMSPERSEHVLEQVCGSLAEAHKQGVVHRDLKPENVVLMDVGDDVDFVKVLDFGIAARKDSTDAAKEAKLTQQGMVLGTPPYMSPEQFMGKELDSRSDIYSLGVMAYEMLTGKLPFSANTPWEWATCHMTAQPSPFEDSPTMTDIPGKMKTAIFRALSKKPEDRQSTVREFFEELSSGNARLRTGTMTPHESAGAESAAGGQRTEMGIPATPSFEPPPPYNPAQASMGPGVGPGMGMGAPAPYVPPPPAPMQYGGSAAKSGGNTGLIAAAVVVGLVVVGALVMIVVKMNKPEGDPSVTLTVPSGGFTAATAAPPTTLSVPAQTASAAPTATPTAVAVHTAPPAPTPVSGDAACAEAKKQATSRNIPGAVSTMSRCSGGSRSDAAASIKANTRGAAISAARNNDCAGARRIASAGNNYGAGMNVDSDPQTSALCKGK